MCVPLAVAAAVAATATSVAGTISQANTARRTANYQAAVARNNQEIANQNAQTAAQVGAAQEAEKRQDIRRLIAAQRVAGAASGLAVNSGSMLALQEDTAGLGELDALTIRDSANRQVRGYQQQGLNYGTQAQADIAAGKAARTAGYISAAGTLFEAGSSMKGSKWNSLKTPNSPMVQGKSGLMGGRV